MDSQITTPLPMPKPRPVLPVEHPDNGASHAANNGHGKPVPDHDQIDLDVPHPKPAWIVVAAVAAVLILAALLVIGLMPRVHTEKELAAAADAALNAPVPVNVVTPKRAETVMDVAIPGTLRPWQEVSIFSRSTGYLKGFYVDISNQVKKDQLMADISTPEVDQQLRAAQATLVLNQAAAAKAKNDMDYAEQTDKRYEQLRGSSSVTQQELDQFANNYKSSLAIYHQAEAQVGVSQANVQQLTELQSFEKIYAPFSGVVTGRTYDVGSFIIANPTASDILPMFKIAENDVLRAFVSVPQNYALTIEKGMKVSVTARERPGREFIGTVLGTTNYLDPTARSLLTEVRIENADLALLPGMFVSTTFHVKRDHPPFLIPAPALVTNADGNKVGIVKDGKVHFQPVTLGVDYGKEIEIVTGLTGDEQIVANPGEKTIEGAQVTIANAVAPTLAAGQPRAATQPNADLFRFDYTAPKMGTVFHMTFYAPDAATADRAADTAWARVDELNAMLSDYDPNSELSKLGQQTLDGPMTKAVPVSDDFYHILELSIDAAKKSDGTFDVTVGPLSQLFRRSRRLETVPTPQRIAEAKKSVGYQFIELDPEHHAVQLLAAKMRLDVGGIAKGYASEAVLKVLREQFNITRALCGAAGDVAIGDPPPDKQGWTVALENLDATAKGRGAYVQLHNYGVSTSGDTERYVIIDGVRYSHIIDPRTGIGLTNRINCSAIASNDILADWLAAAVCILGPERGLELTEQTPGAACRITQIADDGHVKVWESKRFSEFAVEPPATAPAATTPL